MAENQHPSCSINNCCGCVGYAYVPIQYLNDVYSTEEGLCNGTIFPELNLSMCEYGKVCKSMGGRVYG